MDTITFHCPIRRLGNAARHHFFGYYNKTCWDRSGRYVLASRVPMMTAELSSGQVAEVGFFDLENDDHFTVLGDTTAWNWQMGCQLQWLDGLAGRQIIYNARTDLHKGVYPGFCAVIVDADSRQQRQLPLPIYVLAPNSQYALCVDYRRLFFTHETIGYCETQPPLEMSPAPADDGIFKMNLTADDYELICSYQDLRRFHPLSSMDQATHWVSHIEICPDSSRILLLHRWTERIADETCFLHRLITMDPDGGNMQLLECSDHPLPQLNDNFEASEVGVFDYEKSEHQISHPTWRDAKHLLVWGPHDNATHYHLYRDRSDEVSVIGASALTENGHMTYSPNGRWILTDTYPDDHSHERILLLFDVSTGTRYDIGSFYADPKLGKIARCDFHPRWNRDGSQVCIDSVHEDQRQMYLLDVSQITQAGG